MHEKAPDNFPSQRHGGARPDGRKSVKADTDLYVAHAHRQHIQSVVLHGRYRYRRANARIGRARGRRFDGRDNVFNTRVCVGLDARVFGSSQSTPRRARRRRHAQIVRNGHCAYSRDSFGAYGDCVGGDKTVAHGNAHTARFLPLRLSVFIGHFRRHVAVRAVQSVRVHAPRYRRLAHTAVLPRILVRVQRELRLPVYNGFRYGRERRGGGDRACQRYFRAVRVFLYVDKISHASVQAQALPTQLETLRDAFETGRAHGFANVRNFDRYDRRTNRA